MSVFEFIHETPAQAGEKISYEIYQLIKRGKQHIHAGTVQAVTPQEAMSEAKKVFSTDNKVIYNLWAIRTSDIRFTKPEEQELWLTLPEKKFRDASAYKAGDKLTEFLDKQKN